MTISLAISVNYATAESENPEYDFTVLTGDELINSPLASQILQNIELAKQRMAELQEKQRQAEEYQRYLDEQRLIAKQLVQNDLDRMNKKYEGHTPRASFETFLSRVDSSVHDIFWGQFEFQQQKVQAGRAAMMAVYENGGSLEEARQAYFEKAATTRTQIIEVNKNLNIQYGFADTATQQNFDDFGKLPRSEESSQPTEPVSETDKPIPEIEETETESTQINFVKNHSNDKCLKWELKAQKFMEMRKFVPHGIAKKVIACNNSHDSREQVQFLISDVKSLVDDNVVSDKDGKKLTKKLTKLIKKLSKEKTDKVCKDMNKFVKEVNKLIDKGKISQGNGQSLIDSTEPTKATIGCS